MNKHDAQISLASPPQKRHFGTVFGVQPSDSADAGLSCNIEPLTFVEFNLWFEKVSKTG